jgi:S-formylglutathione hydrolase FrmB
MRIISRWFIASFAVVTLVFFVRPGTAQSRTARTIQVESAAIGSPATIAVLLPVDYDTSTMRYPVVYLLHGGTQNHTAFPSRSWFNADVSKRRMIVVMPSLQPLLFEGRAGRPAPVEEFLGHELPAYIDSHYRTVNDRRARAIGGISMGGYGATLLGLERPDLFGAIGAISAALSTGGRPNGVGSLVAALTTETAPYVYIACGVEDGVLPASRDLAAQLRERHIRSELHEVPGGHGWEVWDPQVRGFFDALATLPGWAPTNAN